MLAPGSIPRTSFEWTKMATSGRWIASKKDTSITGGDNIYCFEAENILAGHPDIVEVSTSG